jgi:hypothetical protein
MIPSHFARSPVHTTLALAEGLMSFEWLRESIRLDPPKQPESGAPRAHAKVSRAGLLASLLSIGCSSTTVVSRPLSTSALAEMNDAIEGQSATVVLKGKGEGEVDISRVDEVKVGVAATQLLERTPGGEARSRSVPTAALQQISVVYRGRGAAEGAGLGVLAGGAVGGIVASLIVANTSGYGGAGIIQGLEAVGAVAGGIVLGLVTGVVVGMSAGHRKTIALEPVEAGARCAAAGATAEDSSGAMLKCQERSGRGGLRWTREVVAALP